MDYVTIHRFATEDHPWHLTCSLLSAGEWQVEHRGADGGDLYQRCLLFWRNPHTAETETEIDRQTDRQTAGDSAAGGRQRQMRQRFYTLISVNKRTRINSIIIYFFSLPVLARLPSSTAQQWVSLALSLPLCQHHSPGSTQRNISIIEMSVTLRVSISLIETSITPSRDVSSTSKLPPPHPTALLLNPGGGGGGGGVG